MRSLLLLAIVLLSTPGISSEIRAVCPDPQSAAAASAGCYFYNLPSDQLTRYLAYYPANGMGLQTLAYHYKDGALVASGAFDSSIKDTVPPSELLPATDLANEVEKLGSAGYRARQLSVTVGADGKSRFTTIWQKRGTEAVFAYFDLDDAGFEARWQDLAVGQGFRVEDYAEYFVAGERRHAAIFVNDGDASFYFYNKMSRADLQDQMNSLKLKGFRIATLNSCENGDATEYAAVWKRLSNSWTSYADMTLAEYLQKAADLSRMGYRIHKIQGYRNSTRFSAVWKK